MLFWLGWSVSLVGVKDNVELVQALSWSAVFLRYLRRQATQTKDDAPRCVSLPGREARKEKLRKKLSPGLELGGRPRPSKCDGRPLPPEVGGQRAELASVGTLLCSRARRRLTCSAPQAEAGPTRRCLHFGKSLAAECNAHERVRKLIISVRTATTPSPAGGVQPSEWPHTLCFRSRGSPHFCW